jgi:glutamate/tyrosine decarboxylase-like PLP-dependent enzyme
MRDDLAGAAERAIRYLDGLGERGVAPSVQALRRLESLGGPLPARGSDAREVIAMLDDIASPATVASAGPRFFGFVIGGSLPAALGANWLAGAWDQNAGLWAASPAAAHLEDIALRWLLQALNLPEGCAGALVTGTTVAHATALAAARHAVLARSGWDVEADGLFGAPPIQVVVGEEVHPSLSKALGIVGLGRTRVVKVTADRQGRMRADRLPPLQAPCIVCVQAGNVNSGAFDDTAAVVAAARASKAWVHVDGAFGLWARASRDRSHLARGIEEADSWATDCHKWLNVPYDCGAAFVRDEEALRRAMSVSAAYLPANERREPYFYTPEMSRRARGVEVWAALRSLGREGIEAIIDRNCRQARRFAEALSGARHEVLNDVVLNQVVVSFGDDAFNQRVVQAVQDDGTCWCGGTYWQGRPAMRISVSSWATTDEDVERSVAAILRVVESLRR